MISFCICEYFKVNFNALFSLFYIKIHIVFVNNIIVIIYRKALPLFFGFYTNLRFLGGSVQS